MTIGRTFDEYGKEPTGLVPAVDPASTAPIAAMTVPPAPPAGQGAAAVAASQGVVAATAGRSGLLKRRVAGDRSADLPRTTRTLYGVIGIVVAIALWQILASAHVINSLVTSSPSGVVSAANTLNSTGLLGTSVLQSFQLFAVAFGISLAVGIGGGILIGWYRPLSALFDPLISMMYASPRVALIPLITVWLGVTFQAQVVAVALMAVFPIMINVQAGMRSVDRELVQVARGYLGTNYDVLRTVALPGAVPHIVSGVRQGLSQSLIGVVVAEYLIGNQGIGGMIVSAGQSLDSGEAFVGVLVVAIVALILTMALRRLERRLDHWRH